MEDLDDMFFGAFITLIVMAGVYLMWGGPSKTTSGEYYIRTHLQNYKLVSEKPFKLDIKSSLTEEE